MERDRWRWVEGREERWLFHIAISGHQTVGSVVLEVRETEDVKGWEHRVQVSAVGL